MCSPTVAGPAPKASGLPRHPSRGSLGSRRGNPEQASHSSPVPETGPLTTHIHRENQGWGPPTSASTPRLRGIPATKGAPGAHTYLPAGPAKSGSARSRMRKSARAGEARAGRRADWTAPGAGVRAPAAPLPPGARPGTPSA